MSVTSSLNSLPLLKKSSPPRSVQDEHPSKVEDYPGPVREPKPRNRRWFLTAVAAVVIFVAVSIVLPVYFLVIKRRPNSASPGSGATSGGDGSDVSTDNGTIFTYKNAFGGYWVQDSHNPFNDDARPNSWTPPLNTSWTWGKDRVYGVNIGGWLVLEPFITPQFFQKYSTAKDEWDLSLAMMNDAANGGLSQLEKHYDTFISEQDIAEMAGAGLNFIRVPLPFWAIETWSGEPFLAKVSWKYFLRFLGWARKYGMRVCIDLHTAPGSQNGYNHSGRLSPVNFLNGNMGLANAQRTLYYIRILTEFISQPQYRNLIPLFGIINEPLTGIIGMDQITSFYLEAHNMIRGITGYGAGNGPYIIIHDGFASSATWAGFLQGSDRIAMDKHLYFSFGGEQFSPLDVTGPNGVLGGSWTAGACNSWGPEANESRRTFGVTMVGEFAASPYDCGLFLHGAQAPSAIQNCTPYDSWETYTSDMKQGVKNFVMSSMDAFGDWFFWTWKISAAQSGRIETPLWSYQLGYRNGWIPSDPRQAVGMCHSVGSQPADWDGTFEPWQTGTTSAIPASSSTKYAWPPSSISNADVPVTLLPTYTDTVTPITLPVPTFTSAPSSVTQNLDGWADKADTAGGITTVSGCQYPDEYNGIFSVIPRTPCTGPAPTGISH